MLIMSVLATYMIGLPTMHPSNQCLPVKRISVQVARLWRRALVTVLASALSEMSTDVCVLLLEVEKKFILHCTGKYIRMKQ